MGKNERRERRRQEEKPIIMTKDELVASNRAYYDMRRKMEKDNTIARTIEIVMAAFSLVMAECYGWRAKRLQKVINLCNEHVWKVMQSESDFKTDMLVEAAKKFNIDLQQGGKTA